MCVAWLLGGVGAAPLQDEEEPAEPCSLHCSDYWDPVSRTTYYRPLHKATNKWIRKPIEDRVDQLVSVMTKTFTLAKIKTN